MRKISLNTIVRGLPVNDRNSIWLEYTKSRQVFLNYWGFSPQDFVESGLLPNDRTVRLGLLAQKLIIAILGVFSQYHKDDIVIGNICDPKSIMFNQDDYSKVFLRPIHPASLPIGATWKLDYQMLERIIDFFMSHFQISDDMIPLEIWHFRDLLREPRGWQSHILNHFCLWNFTKRKDFIFQIYGLCHQNDFFYQYKALTRDLAERHSSFNFTHYIPNDSDVLLERWKHFNFHDNGSSFRGMLYFMRDVYSHGAYHQNTAFDDRALEHALHEAFPFAIEQARILFFDADMISRFWHSSR